MSLFKQLAELDNKARMANKAAFNTFALARPIISAVVGIIWAMIQVAVGILAITYCTLVVTHTPTATRIMHLMKIKPSETQEAGAPSDTKQLNQLGAGGAGKVTLRSPDGRTRDFDADDPNLPTYIRNGAVEVPQPAGPHTAAPKEAVSLSPKAIEVLKKLGVDSTSSYGTAPNEGVTLSPKAIALMKELGIPIPPAQQQRATPQVAPCAPDYITPTGARHFMWTPQGVVPMNPAPDGAVPVPKK